MLLHDNVELLLLLKEPVLLTSNEVLGEVPVDDLPDLALDLILKASGLVALATEAGIFGDEPLNLKLPAISPSPSSSSSSSIFLASDFFNCLGVRSSVGTNGGEGVEFVKVKVGAWFGGK